MSLSSFFKTIFFVILVSYGPYGPYTVHSVMAQNKSNVWDLPTEGVESLIITGMQAHVKVISKPSSQIKIQLLGDGVLTKSGSSLHLKLNEPEGKKNWQEAMSKEGVFPTYQIEISGASIPLQMALRSGSLKIDSWKKTIGATFVNASVNVNNMNGDFNLYLHKGNAEVNGHQGVLNISGYSGNFQIKKITGEQNYFLYQGSVNIENSLGNLDVNLVNAQLKLSQGSGDLQFNSQKGTVNIQKLDGRIEGDSDDGNVVIQTDGSNEVVVKTKTANVNVSLENPSGVHLNVLTNEGDINVPKELKVYRSSIQKASVGRLKGVESRGRVWVRSQEGNINIQ